MEQIPTQGQQWDLLGSLNGLHCIYLLQTRNIVTTNHVSFDENDFPTRGRVENTARNETQQETNANSQQKEEEKAAVYLDENIKREAVKEE